MGFSKYFCCASSSKEPTSAPVSPLPPPKTGVQLVLALPMPRTLDDALNYEASLRAYLQDTEKKINQISPEIKSALLKQNSGKARMLMDGHKHLLEEKAALQQRLEEVVLERRRRKLVAVANPMVLR